MNTMVPQQDTLLDIIKELQLEVLEIRCDAESSETHTPNVINNR